MLEYLPVHFGKQNNPDRKQTLFLGWTYEQVHKLLNNENN